MTEFTTKNDEKMPIQKRGLKFKLQENSKCAEKNYCLDKALDVNQRRRRFKPEKVFFCEACQLLFPPL